MENMKFATYFLVTTKLTNIINYATLLYTELLLIFYVH